MLDSRVWSRWGIYWGEAGSRPWGLGSRIWTPLPRNYGITHPGLDIRNPGETITCTCLTSSVLVSLLYIRWNWGAERIIDLPTITSPLNRGNGKWTQDFPLSSVCGRDLATCTKKTETGEERRKKRGKQWTWLEWEPGGGREEGIPNERQTSHFLKLTLLIRHFFITISTITAHLLHSWHSSESSLPNCGKPSFFP